MPDDGATNDLREQVANLRAILAEHRRELLRLHPEVSNFQTVEELKRELIWILEAYSDLLERHIELLTRHG